MGAKPEGAAEEAEQEVNVGGRWPAGSVVSALGMTSGKHKTMASPKVTITQNEALALVDVMETAPCAAPSGLWLCDPAPGSWLCWATAPGSK